MAMPVMLPSGRARFDTRPCSTGLRAETTIGIVRLTARNRRAQWRELVTITSGESRRMSSITRGQSFGHPSCRLTTEVCAFGIAVLAKFRSGWPTRGPGARDPWLGPGVPDQQDLPGAALRLRRDTASPSSWRAIRR